MRAEQQYEQMKEKVLAELKTTFRPEFLNRIDAVVVFKSLSIEEIRNIVDLMLSRVREQLSSQGIAFDVTQDAKDHIIKLGYDVAYGARPLRRVIQNMVEDPLSEQLLVGTFKSGDRVVVDKSEDAGLSITKAAEKTAVAAG
jgi:ATP-dependent Clp protease ATP-binding subunit ClpC